MKIGKAIKLIRNKKEINLAELADKCHISSSYLSLIEQGKRNPNFSLISKISSELKVPTSILVFLASDDKEIKELDSDLFNKLSNLTISLIQESAEE